MGEEGFLSLETQSIEFSVNGDDENKKNPEAKFYPKWDWKLGTSTIPATHATPDCCKSETFEDLKLDLLNFLVILENLSPFRENLNMRYFYVGSF